MFKAGCPVNRGIMGITKIIAIIGLSFAAATVQAGTTNSWIYTGANVNNYHWDVGASWSLGVAPVVSDTTDFITNGTTKAVAINASDAVLNTANLTISNLTVSAPPAAVTTNILTLTNMNAGALVPLHVLNGLTIGFGGVLIVTNSMLQVDGALLVNGGAQFLNLSTVHLSNATFNSSAIMLFALGTNTNTVVVGPRRERHAVGTPPDPRRRCRPPRAPGPRAGACGSR